MKRKQLITVIGLFSPLILAGCAVALLVAGVSGWFLLQPEQKARIIRVVPLAPLATPELTSPAIAAPAAQPPAQVSELTPEAPAPAAAAPAMPADPIEQALGFALPSGSVNSVTQVGVATRLVIPKLSLDAPVVLAPIKDQTWQVDHLGQAVGHLEGTAPPGSESNIVLAGHITLAAEVYGPFAGLGQLISGDEIIVYEGDRPSKYVVDDFQTVERTAVEVTYPSNTGQITLITCQNWDDATGRYLQRLIVKGHLVKS